MRRTWIEVAVVVAVATIVVVVLVSQLQGNGGGRLSAAEWADSVCTSLSGWRSSITALADVSGGTLTPDSLRDRLESARQATEQTVDELRGLGPPDVSSGADVEQALDDAAQGLEERYSELEAAASEAVDAEDQSAFFAALATLADDFQALLGYSRETITTLRSASLFGGASAELEQGFAGSAACQQLG